MFRSLGRGLARHPLFTVIAWVVFTAIASAVAFTPLFGKPLFELLESGHLTVGDTDSDRVLKHAEGVDDEGEAILLVMDGAGVPEPGSDEARAIVALRDEITALDPQMEVADVIAIQDGIAEIDEAMSDARDDVDAQLEQARTDAQAELDAQFAGPQEQLNAQFAGPQAQIDQLAQVSPEQAAAAQADLDDQKAAAQAQLDEQKAAAQAEVDSQLEQARADADEELEKNLAEPREKREEAVEALGRLTATDESGHVLIATLPANLSEDEQTAMHDEVVSAMTAAEAGIAGEGTANVFSETGLLDSIVEQVRADLVTGETVGLPIALLLMVIIFGGLIAAGLPLIGALTSILIGLGGLWVLTHIVSVDSFVINIMSVIGLGLSIDYGLLVVSRYREEVQDKLEAAGFDPEGTDIGKHLAGEKKEKIHTIIRSAVEETVATAGRTVVFSALTIAFSIAGLLAMKAQLLKVISVSGIFIVLLAVITAVTLIPALITLLGPVLLRPSVIAKVPVLSTISHKVSDRSTERGVFSAIARFVHRRPWPILIGVIAILAVLASPIAGMNLRSGLADNLPHGTQVRSAYLTLEGKYVGLAGADMQILADAPKEKVVDSDYVADLREKFGDGSVEVDEAPDATETIINVRTGVDDPVSGEAIDIMLEQRDITADGFDTWVGGAAAMNHDFNQQLADGLPLALAIVIVAVFVLMFLMTGSLLVPVKAALINGFSLIASLGATVWIFQGGHLGMDQVPGLEAYVVAMVLAFGFGLAMDYEVFLLARIKEYWDAGEDNDRAVELGLQKSGRIITSAAVIIIAVFSGFVFGDMRVIKQTGIALAMTVFVDASLVRMLLVPATMTLLGKWNWWAPKPLARLYAKYGISEH